MKKEGKNRNIGSRLGSVITEYRPQLHSYLRSKLGNESDVEDIAQEAFLRLLRVDVPELIKRPHDYLFRIASNVVHDFYLKQSRKPDFIDEGDIADTRTPEDALAAQSNIRHLEDILKELPARQQAAFILKKRDGLRHEEIAKRLDISVHTARAYVSQALAHCRMRWEE